ncbi:hypothetical protein [Priestia megaterium]|uniref:hypothetical protein n=1 Tax=Priestia megaterium TaxID=1404 RepID=UPI000BFD9B96|nr:hypothetical protein [Priestia megaterium]PGR01356.1 hypothetical protein COA23_23180 [Priestia megaterium]
MKKNTLKVFLIEIHNQCDYVIYASEGMQKAIDNCEPKTFWFYAQSLLVATANISKLIWGNKATKHQRKKLKTKLKEHEFTVLKSRDIRNAFEHFDERLYKWVEERNSFIDSNIASSSMFYGGDPKEHLRFFDTDDISIKFNGDSFELHKIIKAVYKLRGLIESYIIEENSNASC